ncbi:hypothetical protein AYI68_g731 [Smittium mucronatum]|uniref:Uncharacterized protein n=1 Tax=Smittium mucronatum TaxID=133383 RepID=A0A1R0H7C8_9FUNG|nr:hypothetical protein AYI68_g731 [Smittium mucronatum]
MSSKKKSKKKSGAVSKIRLYSTTSTPSKSQRELEEIVNENPSAEIQPHDSPIRTDNHVIIPKKKESIPENIIEGLNYIKHVESSSIVFSQLKDVYRISELGLQKHQLKENSYKELKPHQILINLNFRDEDRDLILDAYLNSKFV